MLTYKVYPLIALLICGAFSAPLFADAAPPLDKSITSTAKKPHPSSKFNPFTGKVIGSRVRMRVSPDLDSHIITELVKNDYVIVTGEKGDFYAVEAPDNLKAYIFRGFVIDNVVEGDRVNIRLAPDRESPVIGHFSTGQPIDGRICSDNKKWMEIKAPKNTHFYIAKEYIEYVGKPELKMVQDKRKKTVTQLLESATLLSQAEMHKAFHEIDIERITHNYKTIINDYTDFPQFVTSAKKQLRNIQEEYLHRKIAFLETKASNLKQGQEFSGNIYEVLHHEEGLSSSDRMKVWEPLEEAMYLSWSSMHHAKTMDDFYTDQKMKSQTVSGILEPFHENIKNKPGNYLLKNQEDVTIACVYSTHVNLDNYTGKRVNLIVSSRPNNGFAYPAYYVLEVE